MGFISASKIDVNGKIGLFGCWLALFLVTIVAYFPGLNGPFVLDDFGAIAALGNYGGVRDWETFRAFVFGGSAGPTGRPLSLLTFLVDGTNWPTDSFPFKRTNLIIHLINGVLLGLLIGQILRALDYRARDVRVVAIVTAACWLLHPLLVSTTLYAVQRMAQLSTLLILFGLVSHIYCRAFLKTNIAKAYVLMSVSMGLFTLLAMLSKENGILLPMLIGVVEFTVIASRAKTLPRLNRYWLSVFLVLPSVVILVYLGRVLFGDSFFDVVPPRDFSLYERALTQPRILADYLQHWFIPKLYTTGVFQDHFIKSTGIVAPLTTLLSAAFHAAAIALAIVYRRKWPLFSLACLFFYAAHSLESTTLNLELYFEHRNYLAAVFLFLPLIAVAKKRLSRSSFALAALIVAICLAGFTRYSSNVWASFPSMVEASAKKAPTSARAQAEYANLLFNANLHEEALSVIDAAIDKVPQPRALLLVNRLIILCNTKTLRPEDVYAVATVVAEQPFDPRSIKVYNEFSRALVEKRCPKVLIESILPMFIQMLDVPENTVSPSLALFHIKFLIGYVHAHSDRPQLALKRFEESLRANPGASHAMAMAALMASRGYPTQALYISEIASDLLSSEQGKFSTGTRVSAADILEFQATLMQEINNSPERRKSD